MTQSSTDPALAARLTGMRLYVVSDAGQSPARVLVSVSAACAGGADVIQLRRKGGDDMETYLLAERCRAATAAWGALFIVDDRLDVAMAVDADGVHLGQADLPVAAARRLWPGRLVGVSTHSLAQALAAQQAGADYLGVGPVWATPTKPGRAAVGLELVAAVAAAAVRIPWVAIGGIDAANAGEVLDAGARRLAVVRAVCAAADPQAAAAALRGQIEARPAAAAVA